MAAPLTSLRHSPRTEPSTGSLSGRHQPVKPHRC